ncbi:MAG: hypothetical protein JEZ10_08535 [Verrucomicrobia bacterium]|nr:hypothetical protein [Verrucomicrobiota bacterium]
MKKAGVMMLGLALCAGASPALTTNEINAAHAQVKARYLQFLKGTATTFDGSYGQDAAGTFVSTVTRYIQRAQAFNFTQDSTVVFSLFPEEDAGFEAEFNIYSDFLEQWIPALAYGYTVDAPGNPYYLDSGVKDLYFQSLEYLYGRGVKTGMTFHRNSTRQLNNPTPEGCANLVDMELRMGSYCQAALLMEAHAAGEPIFSDALELVTFLEMLGKSSGHVQYWIPYETPTNLPGLVMSDAVQIYSDVTFVSAMLETNVTRRGELLADAQMVFTDSLKCIPGWADTIKPDFTGYHHRGIYGNAYTGGFMPQAAFGAYALQNTAYAVEAESVENLKQLALTYRLYCQKYAMPFGIRGRMPDGTDHIKGQAFGTYVLFASALGLDDAAMRPVFERLWDPAEIGMDFVFDGGRGKILRGLYAVDMAKELDAQTIVPESDPSGFWYKPYGGLALHRRENWMAAVKGHSKYIWDYESGDSENEYGQYLSHGMVTIFANGSPVSDIASGYNLNGGWDWYRLPGTTAVHFPLAAQQVDEHRIFSSETFLGGVSGDEQNGLFGMILDDPDFPDGISIDLKARKSVFFMDDLIVLLGTGISGGDGTNTVETTVFQSCHTTAGQAMSVDGQTFSDGSGSITTHTAKTLLDPFGNGYYIRDAYGLKLYQGVQNSFKDNGSTPTSGDYSTVWIDHGLAPSGATYEVAVTVQQAATALAADPDSRYQVQRMDADVHQVYFPQKSQTGYAFFNAATNPAVVAQVDEPCLIMTEESAGGLALSVVNPDFARVADSQPVDFSFIAEGMNQYLDSTAQPVVVTLQGYWALEAPAQGVEILAASEEETQLRFDCIDGAAVSARLVVAGPPLTLDFTRTVFEDDFDRYTPDAPLPVGGKWTSSSYSEADSVYVHVRADTGNVFGGGVVNRYLGCRDAGSKSSNLVAKNILSNRIVRLSFDFAEPDNGLTGALSVRMGVDDVKVSEAEVVGGIRPLDGSFDPGGTYLMGAKVHADIYFNESFNPITYRDPNGNPATLASGKIDVWLNGINTADDVENDRALGTNTLSDIMSLRFETYSAGMNEVWFDQIEVAVPEEAFYQAWADGFDLIGVRAAWDSDPDGDGYNNLIEYALGGMPTNAADSASVFPVFGKPADQSFQGLEYIYRRRINAAALGLSYWLEVTPELIPASWSTNGYEETGSAAINDDFETVTNRIPTGGLSGFIRLRVGKE